MTDDAKWEQWKKTAKELSESTTLHESRRRVAGEFYRLLMLADPIPDRPSMGPGPTNTELPQEPQYEHDCDRCVFLGSFVQVEITPGVGDTHYDLYYCAQHSGVHPTVLARYGSQGNEYCSGLANAQVLPALGEAKNRAIAKKLLKG